MYIFLGELSIATHCLRERTSYSEGSWHVLWSNIMRGQNRCCERGLSRTVEDLSHIFWEDILNINRRHKQIWECAEELWSCNSRIMRWSFGFILRGCVRRQDYMLNIKTSCSEHWQQTVEVLRENVPSWTIQFVMRRMEKRMASSGLPQSPFYVYLRVLVIFVVAAT